MRIFLSWVIGLGAGCRFAGAAEPVFTHVHPAGVQAGTAGLVSFVGKFDPWPCQVHAALPGLTFVPQKEPGTFELTVDASVPPGPCLLRAFNAEGASAPVALMIAHRPQTPEAEPNDDFRAPQVLAAGTATTTTINGRLDKADDVDSYQVSLTKGATLVAWVEAHVLAAGADAMLRVTDSHGITLAFNHDGPATMDPLLVFTAPETGTYVVQIMGHKYPAASDIRFAGGKDCVYRLHLSTGPVVRNVWPLAAPKEGLMTVEGWNLPATRMAPEPGLTLLYPMPPASPAELSGTAGGQILTAPCAVSGRPAADRAEDRYPFTAVKGESLGLTVSGPALGSLIDPLVRVLDGGGRELARNDDADGSTEARLIWTAPEDGRYTAVVSDLTQRGGPDFYYRLALAHPLPDVSASSASHALKVEAGKTAAVKVRVVFVQDFAAPLTLTARGLPAGVSAAPVAVPAKGGEITLTITAEAAACPASLPIQLLLGGFPGGLERPVVHRLVSTSENNGVPQGFRQLVILETPDLWLTVTAPPVVQKAAPPAGPDNP